MVDDVVLTRNAGGAAEKSGEKNRNKSQCIDDVGTAMAGHGKKKSVKCARVGTGKEPAGKGNCIGGRSE